MLNTINVAASGLAVSREQVENVMNNIANENTPGYKKRVVGISEASHIDARNTGRGALVGDTTRVTNIYLYDNLTKEQGKQSQYDELTTMLSDIEAIFYETDDSGFSADLNRYFQSLENLRTDPSNEIYRNDLRNTGQTLVDDMKNLYDDIEDREQVSKANLDDHVTEVNTLLKDIGSVNTTIAHSTEISNDLLDKRDQLEQELSKYINIDLSRNENYNLSISGFTAVGFNDNVHELVAAKDYISQEDAYVDNSGNSVSNLINQTTWVDAGDKITYELDNTYDVSVEYGDTVNSIVVDETNIVNALVYEINNNLDMSRTVTAYNGQYVLDKDGTKILTNNPLHPDYDSSNPNKDRFLLVESNTKGTDGKFIGRVVVNDNDTNTVEVAKNEHRSVTAKNDIHLELSDKVVDAESGKLKPIVDNVNSQSYNNLLISYKNQLDNFAYALADMSSAYIKNPDETYVYGERAVDVDTNASNRVNIELFSGNSVKTLKFNVGTVAGLDQGQLDYLATLQWKTDMDIDGTGDNLTSFSKYNQALRVKISDDVENVKLKKLTQDAVTESLRNNYDKLTKVDKDEEMMNLMKFQAAYEANAKLITIIDEMLSTILNMKR